MHLIVQLKTCSSTAVNYAPARWSWSNLANWRLSYKARSRRTCGVR